MHKTHLLALLLTLGLLGAAAPAQAIYIETPLALEAGDDKVDVGDDLDLAVGPNPNNESAKDDWAGKTVKVRYSYDKNEGAAGGPDDSVSNDGYTTGDITTITLSDDATGALTWTIPAALDDHNVDIFLEDDTGERIAFTFIGVGDAEPMMRLASSSGPSDGQPELNEDDKTEDVTHDQTVEASALGIVGLLGALALVGAAVRRR